MFGISSLVFRQNTKVFGLQEDQTDNKNNMAADPAENNLGVSWHDSVWIPILNPTNILEYFSQRTNPFYDRTCNNEVVKMQRLEPSALQ